MSETEPLTHLSLFSGIGGNDLAAEWAGFETVGQCEWADYPIKILEKHWPDVPRWRDIRTLTNERFYEKTGLRTVDIISGGFPCQPFSVAGKQKGKDDDRYLWPEMLRIIRELKPRWVIAENVPGILRIAGRTVCENLESEGYAVTVFDFEAAAVGAKHRRERIFFVANSGCALRAGRFIERKNGEETEREYSNNFERSGSSFSDVVADSDNAGLQGRQCQELRECSGKRLAWQGNSFFSIKTFGNNWWSTEPNVGRVVNGIPSRVDRLKCLGNAVVPQQIYPIFKAIAEVEKDQS